MSPSPFNNHQQHAKKEAHGLLCPSSSSPLRINKDSHIIKKSPSSSSSSSSSSMVNGVAPTASKPQQRHPVIIYTHSPKIIHTHPRDFMALVQKLTGLSKSEEDQAQKTPKSELGNDRNTVTVEDQDHHHHQKNNANNNNNNYIINKNPNKGKIMNDDNESTSVITDENGSNISIGDGQANSCFVPPIFDPPNPCFNNIPFFTPNSLDLLCSTQPYFNYPDSMFLMPNVRNSISSSTLEGLKEFPEFQ